ncbi:serine/threonine-protein kinase [Actinoallomurus sp. CA-142502]|uniref:serine/threonine-protein kinase n=1 Tax=Actinoallomurus sp. CA-142502 TaxID=3239885 RepID=UPI003D8EB478
MVNNEEAPPEKLGPYRRLTRLGSGGMGVVYRAVDPAGRDVAIKVLRPALAADPTARQRLAREIDTMRRVRSPHVAEVLDGDVTAVRPFVVTRFIEGRQLDKVVAEDGPLRGDALRRLALGLARALVAIHQAGVVHRDLKPSNTMMVEGEPVVIDFGIAQSPDSARLTQTGMVTGTPAYMAPEVFDDLPPSPATDVHAWAVTVAFAATGRPPYGTGGFQSVILNVVEGRANLEGVPSWLLPLLRPALNRDPARRPSAAALVEAVAALGDGTALTAEHVETPYRNRATPPEGPAPTRPSTLPERRHAPTRPPVRPERRPTGPRDPRLSSPSSSGRRRDARSGRKWPLAVAGVVLVAGFVAGGVALQGMVTHGTATAHDLPSATPSFEASRRPSVSGQAVPRSPADRHDGTSPSSVPSHRGTRHTPATTSTPRRPRPNPGTTRPTSSESPRTVTPGAFCSPEGATGVTSAGTPMECVRKEGEDQARWRQAE